MTETFVPKDFVFEVYGKQLISFCFVSLVYEGQLLKERVCNEYSA